MSPIAPNPDDVEKALFVVKYWHYFMAGLASLFGTVYVIKKGKDTPAIIPLSEKHIDNKMTICKQQIMLDMDSIIDKKLSEHKHDMLEQIKLIVKAAK